MPLRVLSLEREAKHERITEEATALAPPELLTPLSPSLVPLGSPPLLKASRVLQSFTAPLLFIPRSAAPASRALHTEVGLLGQITRPRLLVGQVLKATLPSVGPGHERHSLRAQLGRPEMRVRAWMPRVRDPGIPPKEGLRALRCSVSGPLSTSVLPFLAWGQ